jgi:hypothetical protein
MTRRKAQLERRLATVKQQAELAQQKLQQLQACSVPSVAQALRSTGMKVLPPSILQETGAQAKRSPQLTSEQHALLTLLFPETLEPGHAVISKVLELQAKEAHLEHSTAADKEVEAARQKRRSEVGAAQLALRKAKSGAMQVRSSI